MSKAERFSFQQVVSKSARKSVKYIEKEGITMCYIPESDIPAIVECLCSIDFTGEQLMRNERMRGRIEQALFVAKGVTVEKMVKASGNSGRVYAPKAWIGSTIKLVKYEI